MSIPEDAQSEVSTTGTSSPAPFSSLSDQSPFTQRSLDDPVLVKRAQIGTVTDLVETFKACRDLLPDAGCCGSTHDGDR